MWELALTFRHYRPTEADRGHGPDLELEAELPGQSATEMRFWTTAVGFDDVSRLIVRNRGNESLVLSNLTVLSGDTGFFGARWLGADGSPAPFLTVTPGAAARLEVRFVPVEAGPRQAVLQFHSNDPDGEESLVRVALIGYGCSANAVRIITNNGTPTPRVHIQVPLETGAIDVLREELPPGLTPSRISHGGHWDPDSRTLQWQNPVERDLLSYEVSGSGNAYELSGMMTANGQLREIAGSRVALTQAPLDSDRDGLPDWWELLYFDQRTSVHPEVDSDRDGKTNLAELRAGTHPLDGGFQAQAWAPFLRNLVVSDESATMEIAGVEGVAYRIEESTDLVAWNGVSTNVIAGQKVVLARRNLPEAKGVYYRAALEER
jgi:hypothetical protein